jgi:hypothetical protein
MTKNLAAVLLQAEGRPRGDMAQKPSFNYVALIIVALIAFLLGHYL